MKIAIIGAHGTGKTTIIDYLKRDFPDYYFYGDIFRELATKLGYTRPREIVEESGISVLVSAALNAYHDIDTRKRVILDQGPVVMMAYYYTHLNRLNEKTNRFIENLARHYTSKIDLYIYFPIGKIPLISDEMRPVDLDFQHAVDRMLKYSLDALAVDKSRIYKVSSIGIHERVEEVKGIIENAIKIKNGDVK